MLRCEIIRTCSHEKVAQAAVLSIGPEFRDRVALLAASSGMDSGAFVADLVRRFDDEATDAEFRALGLATSGSDMPILDGLRWIVNCMIDGPGQRNGGGGGRSPSRGFGRRRRADACARAA